jgi:hypothetical protein
MNKVATFAVLLVASNERNSDKQALTAPMEMPLIFFSFTTENLRLISHSHFEKNGGATTDKLPCQNRCRTYFEEWYHVSVFVEM